MRVLSGSERIIPASAALLLALLLLAAGCPQSAPSDSAPAASSGTAVAETARPPAADFSFTTLAGQQRQLTDYGGRPLVVNFFATT
jgi:cytochrome oxidase Cu insertion factor (SCO1/SenC/PrrC family)